ncbi:hypothetical protein GCM10027280_32190 [Micromonospora polyrhachis]|uniref:Low temperature requirement A protein (LtrA) n=1 Tax=Micromonospora polyrhachis TaxID=1282883 RepID=A0A7W7WQZ7_9ACTN|nr:hypothetical protein [Micromonospora polyrhachis]MBB4960811.1 hypothetical protein [Micromonospora polyrhachis]
MLLQQRTALEGAWKVAVPLLRDSGGGRLYVSLARPSWHSAVLVGGLVSMTREGLAVSGLNHRVAVSYLAYAAAAAIALLCGQVVSWYARSERTSRVLSGLLSAAGLILTSVATGPLLMPQSSALVLVLGLTCVGELGYRFGKVGEPAEAQSGVPGWHHGAGRSVAVRTGKGRKSR